MQIALVGVALCAGFVDAIAGGGGLLTVPALLLSGLDPLKVLGTNKGQSVWGSGMALTRFYHSPLLDRKRIVPSFTSGLAGSLVGVWCVSRLPGEYLKPVVMILLASVAVFMIFYKPPAPHVERGTPRHPLVGAIWIATLIGFYDGFFGPGTGSFLILAYVLWFHDLLHHASANAKVVNFASNVGSVAMFSWLGLIEWKVALPMACGQAVGGWVGAHVTVRKGQRLVRVALVVVSLALLARLGWQVFT